MEKFGAKLNLLVNVPQEIKLKIVEYTKSDELLQGKLELVALLGSDVAKAKERVQAMGGVFEDLGFGFAIITIDASKLNDLAQISEIQYIELPKTLFSSFVNSNNISCINQVWSQFDVTGKGVLVGFLDSGIDYMHQEFRDKNGDTRIDYIYDLSKGAAVYNSEQINKAIKSPDPFSVVPHIDDNGHGSHVASIACGSGITNARYRGVAYESSIAMVKMTAAGKVNYGKSTQLMRGLKFLIDKSKELNKPLSVNLSFSTNDGAHDGNSLLEQYINIICELERMSMSIATGNEGDAAHHVSGTLTAREEINFNIAGEGSQLVINIYKNILDNISIEIQNPQSISSGVIALRQGYSQGQVLSDRFYIYVTGPTPLSINGEIIISIVSTETNLQQGQWRMIITCENPGGRPYNIWMPVTEQLSSETRFLNPDPYGTLGIPATVQRAIGVGSYNSDTNTISSFSGRGSPQMPYSKPDIVAPGEGIEAAIPGGFYDTLSGTSMAAPHVAGAAALMMEWGLIKGKDPFLYGERLKAYLLKGAKRGRPGIIYPSPIWGYGTLCLYDTFRLIQTEKRGDRKYVDCGEAYLSPYYNNYIICYKGDIAKEVNNTGYACLIPLYGEFGIITIQKGKEEEIFNSFPEIIASNEEVIFTAKDIPQQSIYMNTRLQENYYGLESGEGVIIGIVDSGIDCMNEEFQTEEGKTRIVSVWDQSADFRLLTDEIRFGYEYTDEYISDAIEKWRKTGNLPENGLPFDSTGHGTAVAGIACARGVNPKIKGIATNCDICVVKLKEADRELLDNYGVTCSKNCKYSSVDVILGMDYLFKKAISLDKSIAILVPMGTNMGAHDGSNIIDKYIDTISKYKGVVVVTGTGDDGDSRVHASGIVKGTDEADSIELNIGKYEKTVHMQIWAETGNIISIEITSPRDVKSGRVPASDNKDTVINYSLEGSIVSIRYKLPEPLSRCELIELKIMNPTSGKWTITVFGDSVESGKYDAWLPQSVILQPNTGFVKHEVLKTLLIPSTGNEAVSTSYYNQKNEKLIKSSGVGYLQENNIKPDIMSRGIDILTAGVSNTTQRISGSSAAVATVGGAVALLLQWGIVQGFDKEINAAKIKELFAQSSKKIFGYSYPNPEQGYGILDINGVLEAAKANTKSNRHDKNDIKTFFNTNIYYRIPCEIKKCIKL